MPKNYLLLCELFHPHIHGYQEQYSDPSIRGHYMIIHIDDNSNNSSDENDYYDTDSDSEDDFYILNEVMIDLYKKKYKYLTDSYKKNNIEIKHPLIRNYFKIISNENYITPQIGYKVSLSGNESAAILKTFWIRIVQKCWRRVYKARKEMLTQNNIINYLRLREINTNYHNCHNNIKKIPTIVGMFWSG